MMVRQAHHKKRRGVTMIELVIVIAIGGIFASAFVIVLAPSMNFFFYYPQSSRVNSAAADLMQIILEGDELAKGLRHAGTSCKIGGVGGGGSGITTASSSGSTQTLTYNYVDSDYCDSNAARTARTVTLVYDSSTGTVTRAIDGGAAAVIPKYVGSSSDVNFSVSGGGTDLFHYIGDNGTTDLGPSPLAAISYVQNVGTATATAAGTTLAVTVPGGGVAKGNLIVVYFAMDGDANTVSAADTQGNTYAIAANAQFATPSTGNVRTVILYTNVSTALVSGNTITVTHPNVAVRAMSVSAFAGVNTLDRTAAATGTSVAPSSGNATTLVANEVLIGAIGVEGPLADSFTAGASFITAPPTEAGTALGTADSNITIDPEYRIVSATGTYAATGTITSRDWATALATFYGSDIYRVDVDVIATSGSGEVKHDSGQIRLKSGVEIKRYTT